MSRKATSRSYGPEVLGFKLPARDLAILRAICWSIHPKLRRTRPLTAKALARLTGVESPTMQSAAFKRLTASARPRGTAARSATAPAICLRRFTPAKRLMARRIPLEIAH